MASLQRQDLENAHNLQMVTEEEPGRKSKTYGFDPETNRQIRNGLKGEFGSTYVVHVTGLVEFGAGLQYEEQKINKFRGVPEEKTVNIIRDGAEPVGIVFGNEPLQIARVQGAAERAGVEPGWYIRRVDDEAVKNENQFVNKVQAAGSSFKLTMTEYGPSMSDLLGMQCKHGPHPGTAIQKWPMEINLDTQRGRFRCPDCWRSKKPEDWCLDLPDLRPDSENWVTIKVPLPKWKASKDMPKGTFKEVRLEKSTRR